MSTEFLTEHETISREEMVHLLNEDLAREYQAIIAYTVYSQVIKGAAYTDIAGELEKHAAQELEHALKLSRQINYFGGRSEEHTSELQSRGLISYAVFCLKK